MQSNNQDQRLNKWFITPPPHNSLRSSTGLKSNPFLTTVDLISYITQYNTALCYGETQHNFVCSFLALGWLIDLYFSALKQNLLSDNMELFNNDCTISNSNC